MSACFGHFKPKKWTIGLFFLAFWWWFGVVCGGLSASFLVSLPMPQILVVMCGGFGFFPVVCGGLR